MGATSFFSTWSRAEVCWQWLGNWNKEDNTMYIYFLLWYQLYWASGSRACYIPGFVIDSIMLWRSQPLVVVLDNFDLHGITQKNFWIMKRNLMWTRLIANLIRRWCWIQLGEALHSNFHMACVSLLRCHRVFPVSLPSDWGLWFVPFALIFLH